MPPSATPPRIVGYDLQQLIGDGGLATVWVALEQQTNSQVAVKVLRERSERASNRVTRELTINRRLRNMGGVVTTYQHARTDDGFDCLVMPYLAGGSLAKYLGSDERLSPDQVCSLARWLAYVLNKVHLSGVRHLDIKPSNILIDEYGSVALADFGISWFDQAGEKPIEATIAFTDRYAPPEQKMGEPTDRRADVFGLGATLIALLTGEPPKLDMRGGRQPIEYPHDWEWFGRVLDRATQYQPDDRYAEAGDMLSALRTQVPPPEARLPIQRASTSTAVPPLADPPPKVDSERPPDPPTDAEVVDRAPPPPPRQPNDDSTRTKERWWAEPPPDSARESPPKQSQKPPRAGRAREPESDTENLDVRLRIEVPRDKAAAGAVNTILAAVTVRCETCGGTGVQVGGMCVPCQGKRRVTAPVQLTFKVPAGLAPGGTICLRGKGSESSTGSRRGDVYVTVDVTAETTNKPPPKAKPPPDSKPNAKAKPKPSSREWSHLGKPPGEQTVARAQESFPAERILAVAPYAAVQSKAAALLVVLPLIFGAIAWAAGTPVSEVGEAILGGYLLIGLAVIPFALRVQALARRAILITQQSVIIVEAVPPTKEQRRSKHPGLYKALSSLERSQGATVVRAAAESSGSTISFKIGQRRMRVSRTDLEQFILPAFTRY